MQNTVNILGTDYKLIETNELESKDRDGETRNYSKEIYIRPTEKMFDTRTFTIRLSDEKVA